MKTVLTYDGSFEGFLTAIFERYDRKLKDFSIIRTERYQPELMTNEIKVENDSEKSNRVWTGLKKRLSTGKRNEFYKTFLSELPEMERVLSDFILYAFSTEGSIEEDLGNPTIISVTKIAHQVHREKHRMEAFIRFQRMKNGLYFAMIEPDFNVIPLIARHFKDRYADQQWLIYDKRRKYGINYDHTTAKLSEVQIGLTDESSGEFLPDHLLHDDEVRYQNLWKDYFKTINIPARKNMKLHVQHVPTRYWKYLVEKRGFD